MLAALVLLLIGIADIVRPRRTRAAASAIIAVIWAVLALTAWFGFGVLLWGIVISVLVAGAWLATTTSSEHGRRSAGLWPVAGVAVAALALLLASEPSSMPLSGFAVEWYENAWAEHVQAVSLPTLALAAALLVFLTESGNVIVRAALHPRAEPVPTSAVRVHDTKAVPRSGRTARRRRREEGPAASQPAAADTIDLSAADLRGGRLIGPLERLLIAALTLSGSYAIVAAVIAAKGIVRFPEISRDGSSGSKAEYFLVGSLVSWTVAIAAAGLLWLSAQTG